MSGNTDIIGIIPARWGSTRFPGKPLAEIGGQTMVERVWRRASEVLPRVVIATDDERIAGEAARIGAEAVMTSAGCVNGTARVLEAYRRLGATEGIVVNVQGDEPFVDPALIGTLAAMLLADPDAGIATSATRYDLSAGWEGLADPNRVKMVTDRRGRALYFSRAVIPYLRSDSAVEPCYLIHTGLYAYRASLLPELVESPPTLLEECERLEQLRWLEDGHVIVTALSDEPSLPIDTPADLERVRVMICGNRIK